MSWKASDAMGPDTMQGVAKLAEHCEHQRAELARMHRRREELADVLDRTAWALAESQAECRELRALVADMAAYDHPAGYSHAEGTKHDDMLLNMRDRIEAALGRREDA